MLNLKKTKTLSAVALAVAVIGAPTLAHAGNYSSAYENCKRSDTESQLLGGVLGAVAGGVFGSQVAGNGARTEGSVLGAVLGGAAGSQIANKDCGTRSFRNEAYTTSAPVYSSGGYTSSAPVYSSGHTTSAPIYSSTTVTSAPVYSRTTVASAPVYSSGSYSTGGYTTSAPVYSPAKTVYTSPRVINAHHPVSQPSYGRTVTRDYGYNGYRDNSRSHGGYNDVASINRQIRDLRFERKELERRARYEHNPRLDRRIERIGHRIGRLKQEKRYAKNNRGYDQPRSGHYHGSNVCYTTH